MSAVTVYQGLEERFRTVEGLKTIILGEPTGGHELPCLYTAYERFTRPLRNAPPARNLTAMDHTFAHRLLIRWQDFEQAEMQLLTFVDAIPDAIDRDPKLGGRLTKGYAAISEGITGFVTISNIKYRVIDFTSAIIEKREGT